MTRFLPAWLGALFALTAKKAKGPKWYQYHTPQRARRPRLTAARVAAWRKARHDADPRRRARSRFLRAWRNNGRPGFVPRRWREAMWRRVRPLVDRYAEAHPRDRRIGVLPMRRRPDHPVQPCA